MVATVGAHVMRQQFMFDLDAADLLACEHVGWSELSLWFVTVDGAYVIVLCDATVLAVFTDEERALRYYADVLAGLRLATAVP